ncbi:hypothetical protein C8R45DRAFT_936054 [Mycena sanguinolenta]|nr:hypothetical protein C8R45DRAFT_936054 [Mycena sanguinolenta]
MRLMLHLLRLQLSRGTKMAAASFLKKRAYVESPNRIRPRTRWDTEPQNRPQVAGRTASEQAARARSDPSHPSQSLIPPQLTNLAWYLQTLHNYSSWTKCLSSDPCLAEEFKFPDKCKFRSTLRVYKALVPIWIQRMPPSSITEILVDNIIASVNTVILLLNELHDSFDPPFILAITNTAVSLMRALQNVKTNKEECYQLTANIHGIIYAIVNIHMQSEPPGCLLPATSEHIGKFTETFHHIHTFVEAQQDSNKIKQFFRQNQMNALLKNCRTGLQSALNSFAVTLSNDLGEMRRKTQLMQDKLLELISTLSDSTISDRDSSMYQTLNKSQTSSQSLSLLPSMPQIFYGRDSELTHIVEMLTQQCAKIAILGPGGIGKTNLARTVLHHPDVAARYRDRLFVSCESATTSVEVAGFIAAHLGLKPGKNLIASLLRTLAKKSTCLLILDNLETTWEPLESRSGTEDLLSSLTDIPYLALMVTMRGAEHPAKVCWTRPFLPPLAPLSAEAARQTFDEIADSYHESKVVDKLLQFTDNMPLAVDLMAHLVAYEGCAAVLVRLETKKTSMLSEGSDRRSNLDASIALSLSSPRLAAQPGAIDLLQLLSILPDGLSDAELVQAKLATVIPQILACKSVLLSTSLAYIDSKKRLKSLVPIQEYLQHFHPVAATLVQPLQVHFHSLLSTYKNYEGSTQVTNIMKEITLNLGNIHQVLSRALTPQNPALPEAIRWTITLNSFARLTSHGSHVLMHSIQALLPPGDHELAVEFSIEAFLACNYDMIIEDLKLLASEAKAHCQSLSNPTLEAELYRALGAYYCWYTNNHSDEGIQCFYRALMLARDANDTKLQCRNLINLAQINWRMGKYSTSEVLADKAYILAQLCGSCYHQANALRVKAYCAKRFGNLPDSLYLLQTARKLLGLCGMTRSTLNFDLTLNVAITQMEKSEYREARSLLTQVLSETSAGQEPEHHAFVLLNIAQIGTITGASKQDMLQSLEMAKALLSNLEHFSEAFYYEMLLAELELREGDILIAKNRFEKCLKWPWTKDALVSSHCIERMADINRWGPANFDWAATSSIIYLAFSQKTQQKLELYKALCSLGAMFLSHRDELTAESLFTVALEAFTEMDIHHLRANCMLQLGDIAAYRGDTFRAERLWRDAQPLFEKSLQAKDIANIDSRLASVENTHEGAVITLA